MAPTRGLTGRKSSTSSPIILGGGGGGGRSSNARFRLRHLVFILCSFSAILFFFGGSSTSTRGVIKAISPKEQKKLLAFCPWSTRTKHTPTIILSGSQAEPPSQNRTYFVTEPSSSSSSPSSPSSSKSASFLPLAYPPRDLRIAQTLSGSLSANAAGQGRLGAISDDEAAEQVCKVHLVPSSPRPPVPSNWRQNSIMFGMSTTPDRVLWNLPVWAHWIPANDGGNTPLDPTSTVQTAALPLVLVLTPPPNPTEQLRTREAVDEAHALGMNVKMRAREAERFETRYFALAEEMWKESQARSLEGSQTDWFIFSYVVVFPHFRKQGETDASLLSFAATTTPSSPTSTLSFVSSHSTTLSRTGSSVLSVNRPSRYASFLPASIRSLDASPFR